MVPGHFLSLLTPDAKYEAPACRAEAGNGGPTPKPQGSGKLLGRPAHQVCRWTQP